MGLVLLTSRAARLMGDICVRRELPRPHRIVASSLSRLRAFWLVLRPFWGLLHLGLIGPHVFHRAIWHYLVCALWHYLVCAIWHYLVCAIWHYSLYACWHEPWGPHNLCREYRHRYSR